MIFTIPTTRSCCLCKEKRLHILIKSTHFHNIYKLQKDPWHRKGCNKASVQRESVPTKVVLWARWWVEKPLFLLLDVLSNMLEMNWFIWRHILNKRSWKLSRVWELIPFIQWRVWIRSSIWPVHEGYKIAQARRSSRWNTRVPHTQKQLYLHIIWYTSCFHIHTYIKYPQQNCSIFL